MRDVTFGGLCRDADSRPLSMEESQVREPLLHYRSAAAVESVRRKMRQLVLLTTPIRLSRSVSRSDVSGLQVSP
jgi:hypothetical protein